MREVIVTDLTRFSTDENVCTAVIDVNTGDIVKLKSGGPDMTVQGAANTSGTSVYCQWFAGEKLERGHFPVDSLESVEEGEE